MADVNYESHVKESNLLISDRQYSPENPTSYSDILKFSNCESVLVTKCIIYGGNEDCIDAVRGTDYSFDQTTLIPLGKNGITLKGSIKNFNIEDVTYAAHGTECDIELGQFDNYWYIGRPPTRGGVIINTTATDNKPIKIKVWDADVPMVASSSVKIVKIPKIIWFPYFVFRCIQVRGFKGLFKPVPDDNYIATT